MKNFLIVSVLSLLTCLAHAKTQIYQCAVEKVVPRGVRLNVVENKGVVRGNLIFGTTVSGQMYNLVDNGQGYDGVIKSKPQFTLELIVSSKKAKNSNIDGYKSHLKAVYQTVLNRRGYDVVDTDLVCGKKISTTWQ